MLDRFVRLCEIPSPTGSERAVADDVLAELRDLGVEVREDDAAARRAGRRGQPDRAGPGDGGGVGLVLRASRHGPGGRHDRGRARRRRLPQPRRDDPRRRQQGGRDRAGRARRAARRAPARRPGLELVFTVAEEDGLRGAKELDLGALRSPFGLRARPREPDRRGDHRRAHLPAPGGRVRGRRGPRGIRPEDGRSAIEAAAAAVASMSLGRLDDETTANVGVIDGRRRLERGRRARCRVEAEARSLDEARSPTSRPRCSAPAPTPRASGAATSTSTSTEVFRGYRQRSSSAGGGARARGARALRDRAARGRHRRRQRRERARRPRLRRACCSPTAPRPTTPPRRASAAARITQMLAVCEAIAELAGASGVMAAMLKLRRGDVVVRRPAHGRDRRRAPLGLGRHRAGRASRGRRRGGRQHPGARPRARLGRLRRRPREPQPRPARPRRQRRST